MTSSKFRDTNFETKSTLHTTKNNQTYNSIKSRTKHNFSRTANINTNKNRNSSLPYITNYNPKTDEKNFLTYFGNIFTKDYVKNIYKEKIEPKKESNENINLNKKKNKTFRDDKNEYIRKTNEIKRLKYELDLKKHALEDFKFNLMNKINSFEKTNADILAYKEDIENNFISRYNDNLRKLSRKLYDLKIELDIQNNKLKGLKNDINNLKQSIVKKENCLKDIEKWLKLQIFIKEGKNPTDLKKALIKYKGKLIFNSMEELEGHINYKQSQNLRLIQKYNKIEKEKDIIDELLEKIRNKQDLGIPKADPKKAFEQLEQDLKLGLEQLNQIKTNSNKKTILDTQNELEKKNFEKNKKYNEVISELTKTITKTNDLNNKYRKGTYYNYKNLFILNPSFYFQEEKKNKILEIPNKKEDRFYMSNIDGKIIINGERKNIDNINNNYCKSERRYYSVDKKKNIGINSLQNFGIRKVNYYDKNYFMRELNRMNNFLFS